MKPGKSKKNARVRSMPDMVMVGEGVGVGGGDLPEERRLRRRRRRRRRRKGQHSLHSSDSHHSTSSRYSLVPKESNVTLVPHITFIRPNTLLVKAVMTLFWVNTKRKTVMTLIRIVLLSNGCAVITLFKIYLKRVMTDPFTFECHYSLLDHVKLKLQS